MHSSLSFCLPLSCPIFYVAGLCGVLTYSKTSGWYIVGDRECPFFLCKTDAWPRTCLMNVAVVDVCGLMFSAGALISRTRTWVLIVVLVCCDSLAIFGPVSPSESPRARGFCLCGREPTAVVKIGKTPGPLLCPMYWRTLARQSLQHGRSLAICSLCTVGFRLEHSALPRQGIAVSLDGGLNAVIQRICLFAGELVPSNGR